MLIIAVFFNMSVHTPKKASVDLLSGQWLHRVKTTNLHAHACGLFIPAHVHPSVLHLLVRFSRWGKQFSCGLQLPGGYLVERWVRGCAARNIFFRITVQYCTYQLSPATEFTHMLVACLYSHMCTPAYSTYSCAFQGGGNSFVRTSTPGGGT